jgi:hypothetical protein
MSLFEAGFEEWIVFATILYSIKENRLGKWRN